MLVSIDPGLGGERSYVLEHARPDESWFPAGGLDYLVMDIDDPDV